MRDYFLQYVNITLLPPRRKSLLALPDRPLVLHLGQPLRVCADANETPDSCKKHLVSLDAGNIPIVLPGPRLDGAHHLSDAGSRVPLVHDELPKEESVQRGAHRSQRAHDGNHTANAVARKHVGQGAEAGDEYDGGKIDPSSGIPLRHGRRDGGAQAVAKEDDARGRDSNGIQHVVDDGHAVD
ncbi:hypothetical protein PpBr36_08335 [Pyricularia pennisetigena]|uniref:hypothetical protein n=1 Tax=Pyricularia pennisetigena TaxID=1578925 RepID=UPI001153F45F|nr:hypothetical protein PpBr36_08335 [Pyricularia pennisetigena]TLS24629.1 hypothetical protein PpBr36_08335 [Pyricularia pennisetigena]